jgi:hypothetical protein
MVAAAKASLPLLIIYLYPIQQLISRHHNIQRAPSGLRFGCSSAASIGQRLLHPPTLTPLFPHVTG